MFAGSIAAASTSQVVDRKRLATYQNSLAADGQRTDCHTCPFAAASDNELPPHLRYIAERWDCLQPHVREAIFTLIDASQPNSCDEECKIGKS